MRKLVSLPLGKLNIQINKPREFIFRVPLINNRAGRFGLASKMIFLLWCICGGLLLHMFEANFLSILLKPIYGKPIDTIEDILDRGFKVVSKSGYDAKVAMMKKSPSISERKLAENFIIAKV